MAGVNTDEAIQQFLALTNASTDEARQYLEACNGDVEDAVDAYFTASAESGGMEDSAVPQPPSSIPSVPASADTAGGGRTLAGGSAPAASSSSRNTQPSTARRQPPRRSGPVTIGDLSGGGQGHGHDDDDDDDDREGQNMFVGGDKSGLAVQNPNSAQDIMNRLFQRAQQNQPRPGGEDDDDEDEQPGASNAFGGRGMTLGGDDAPSTVVEDPRAQRGTRPAPLPRVARTLYVWRNGFSIDDGPLRDPSADPENARILQMIMHGQAPMHILNVQPGQEVDVNLVNKREEDYTKPKTVYKPFSGSGQRLGEEGAATASTPIAAGSSSQPKASTSSTSAAPSVDVNASQPTITLQLRLGDGTRLQSRFNTTHTISDVYSFVNAASPASSQRPYVLSSTFPPKDFDDQAAVLGDLPEFKRGGVMVQKWK